MDPQKPDTTSRWIVFGAAVAALGVSIASVILAATQPGDPLAGSGASDLNATMFGFYGDSSNWTA